MRTSQTCPHCSILYKYTYYILFQLICIFYLLNFSLKSFFLLWYRHLCFFPKQCDAKFDTKAQNSKLTKTSLPPFKISVLVHFSIWSSRNWTETCEESRCGVWMPLHTLLEWWIVKTTEKELEVETTDERADERWSRCMTVSLRCGKYTFLYWTHTRAHTHRHTQTQVLPL